MKARDWDLIYHGTLGGNSTPPYPGMSTGAGPVSAERRQASEPVRGYWRDIEDQLAESTADTGLLPDPTPSRVCCLQAMLQRDLIAQETAKLRRPI